MSISLKHLALCTAICIGLGSLASADELIVSFVGELTTFNGPEEISPFSPDGRLGGGVAANPDLLRADGQFVVKNFDPNIAGTQTFEFAPTVGSSAGVEFFLHTPLLERVEAYTNRIGSNSPQGYTANTKILLTRIETTTTADEGDLETTGYFNTGTLRVEDGGLLILAMLRRD